MWTMLDQYGVVILDYTALFTELDAGLMNRLKTGGHVYAAPTFGCACRQMPMAAPSALARRMQQNSRMLENGGLQVQEESGAADTFGLAQMLAGRGESVLVIEANYDLEDRLACSGLRVDAYNLLDKRLIPHGGFPKGSLSGREDGACAPQEFYPVKEGDTVYENGERRILGAPLQDGTGREAMIYHVKGAPQLLAKVYQQEADGAYMLTAQKLHNIHMLCECEAAWRLPWAAMPQSLLTVDRDGCKPVGFLMQSFGDVALVAKHPLFGSGNILEKFPACQEATVGDVLSICQRLVRQAMFLAANDIHISDFNPRNFGIPTGKEDYVAMLDADSFSCEDFRSEFSTYSALHPDRVGAGTKLELLELCSESLVAFVFSLLSLDATFEPMRRGEFSFSAARLSQMRNPALAAKWQSIPANLRGLFQRVFEKGERASMEVLLCELEKAAESPSARVKYAELYRDVLAQAGAAGHADVKQGENAARPMRKPVAAAAPAAQKQRLDHVAPVRSVRNDRPIRRKRGWCGMAACLALVLTLCTAGGFLFGDSLPGMADDGLTAGAAEMPGLPAAQQSRLLRTDMPDGYYLSEDGDLNGYAEYYWYSGSVYKGEWHNGAMHGKGTLRMVGGKVYSGDFVNGSRTGVGTETSADGTIYCGSFVDGEWHGSGTLYGADGNMVYSGGFAHGLFEGRGSYYFPNGIEFVGDFVAGTGMFRESLPLGSTPGNRMLVEGSWFNNVFYGTCYVNGVAHTLPEI